jgi:hypothetical protein
MAAQNDAPTPRSRCGEVPEQVVEIVEEVVEVRPDDAEQRPRSVSL